LILMLGWMLIEPLTNRWPFFNVAFAYFFSFLILGGFYVITAHKKIFFKEATKGRSIPTDPLGNLPVLNVLNASFIEVDQTLGFGTVAHDYLKEK